MRLVIIIFFVFSSTQIFGQTAAINYFYLGCEHECTFDSTKVSRLQIMNCLNLVRYNRFRLTTLGRVLKQDDYQRIDSNRFFSTLNNEYEQKSQQCKSVDLPNTAFWQDYRKKVLEEQDSYLLLISTRYRAYYNTNVLHGYPYNDSCMNRHALALISDTTALLAEWELIYKKFAKESEFPEQWMSVHWKKLHSDQRLIYARLETLDFGWLTCGRKNIKKPEDTYSKERVAKEMDALFLSVKRINCDEE